MKDRDGEKWWIDSDIVKDAKIKAETLPEALLSYAKRVDDSAGISISKTAMRRKSPMYCDTKDGKAQKVGYVITGKTSIQDGYGPWVDKYIDLWVSVYELSSVFRLKS
jgi:hypothetical protein